MQKQLLFLILLSLLLAVPVSAQESMTPSVTVSDQVSLNGTVVIESAYSEGPGFVVIHIDNEGAPGPVIGQQALNPGLNTNVAVPIDAAMATSTLYAMLHADTGEVGVYEFGTVEGADGPVSVDGQVVTPAFNVAIINGTAQPAGDTVTIASATIDAPGWMVIHSSADGAPGPVLGQTQLEAGTTTDIVVELAAEGRTAQVFPMLHYDTGEAGVYEFGTVEGADGPVAINGKVATTPITTGPSLTVADQPVLNGDNAPSMMEGTPMVMVDSVVSEGPGFVVIHIDNEGAPGPVAGVLPVADGLTMNVAVPLDMLDAAEITPVLWPMLHVDTGEVGTYEFGTVDGADTPVSVDGEVVTFPISAAPSMNFSDQALGEGNTITVESVVTDAPGWLVIHSSADGAPGPVLASYPLVAGLNRNIVIELDPAEAGTQVFPMLHYDTGEAGVYEFGTVEGADGPISVGGSVVVAPMNLGG